MTRLFATVCLFAAVTVRAFGLGDDFDILYALLLLAGCATVSNEIDRSAMPRSFFHN